MPGGKLDEHVRILEKVVDDDTEIVLSDLLAPQTAALIESNDR